MEQNEKEKAFLIDNIKKTKKLGLSDELKEEAIFEGLDPEIIGNILDHVINKHRNDFVLTIGPGNYYIIFTGKENIIIKDIEDYGK